MVKKCTGLFIEIAEKNEDYNKFYEAFSKNLKLIIHEDSQNRTKIVDMLRYPSNKGGRELTNREDYVTQMKERHNGIFYISCESNNKTLLPLALMFSETLLKQ